MILEDGMYVKAVGVTFSNQDGESRQAILKTLSEQYGDTLFLHDIKLQRFTYQGSPAFHVLIDDKVIGSLPADLAAQVADYRSQGYKITPRDPRIIGGTIDDWDDELDEEVTRTVNWGLSFYLDVEAPGYRPPAYHPQQKSASKGPAPMRYADVPISPAPAPKKPIKVRNIWKLILGILCLLWGLQLWGYNALAFFGFGLIGGALIFWWLLWDVWPKEKKPKKNEDYRRGPDL